MLLQHAMEAALFVEIFLGERTVFVDLHTLYSNPSTCIHL